MNEKVKIIRDTLRKPLPDDLNKFKLELMPSFKFK